MLSTILLFYKLIEVVAHDQINKAEMLCFGWNRTVSLCREHNQKRVAYGEGGEEEEW